MELEELARDLGASAFRGRQPATWLSRKGVGELLKEVRAGGFDPARASTVEGEVDPGLVAAR